VGSIPASRTNCFKENGSEKILSHFSFPLATMRQSYWRSSLSRCSAERTPSQRPLRQRVSIVFVGLPLHMSSKRPAFSALQHKIAALSYDSAFDGDRASK
jgi:hypothetical protein